MQFNIGASAYVVQRHFGLELDGQCVKGYVDHDAEIIWIDGLIENPEEFERILRHEQAHAWEWIAGSDRDGDEGRSQFVSMCGTTFDRDYKASSGSKGFLALPITGTRPVLKETKRIPTLSSAFQMQRCCGMCGQAYAAGSVANSDPVPIGGDSYIMDRFLRCPMCETVTCWRESCDEAGTPTGGIINAKVLSGQDAARWLEKNPAPPCEWNVA